MAQEMTGQSRAILRRRHGKQSRENMGMASKEKVPLLSHLSLVSVALAVEWRFLYPSPS